MFEGDVNGDMAVKLVVTIRYMGGGAGDGVGGAGISSSSTAARHTQGRHISQLDGLCLVMSALYDVSKP